MTTQSHDLQNSIHPKSLETTLPEPLRTWNQTATEFPRDKTVAQLFEEVAEANPGAVAVVFRDQRITYAQLNVRANLLAHRLRRMGVGVETMVGCCIDRSPELIVALLAILKAGGAYVPLDPAYPKERLDLMLDDTGATVMLTQKSFASHMLDGRGFPGICVDEPSAIASTDDDANPPPAGGPTSLAYVMYTSGSTGKPKGVMIENRAIVRLVRNTNYCNFGPDEVFCEFAPVSFDASTFEIWGPLLNGGRLVIIPGGAVSLEELGCTLRRHGVTTLFLTTAFFNLMVDQRLEDLATLRQLYTGGEFVSARHFRMAHENLPNCSLYHVYGPTENTTFSTYYLVPQGRTPLISVPIGRPISNTQVYILDEQMLPVAVGETGELYTAGDGLARGYLNNSGATSEKFVPDPFVSDVDGQMYRTGDLARWTADGNVEFLGRIDNQVKILGHRIEPGEIETVLTMHRDVKHACVVPNTDENGTKRLVAYYAPSSQVAPGPRELKQFLQGKLPPYMVPALFVPLASLPLSTNGKVDRAALPEPVFASESAATTEAPGTPLEQMLVDLWKSVLRIEHVSLDDNFFDVGGDSLLLVAVHSNLQKHLKTEIQVTDLFEFTTVRTLAQHLGKNQPADPSFSEIQVQAQKQREAFARQRDRRVGGAS
jgi:amino acid adenylation domain-containing protein